MTFMHTYVDEILFQLSQSKRGKNPCPKKAYRRCHRTIIDGSALGTVPHEVLGFSEDKVKGNFVVRSPRKELNHPVSVQFCLLVA